MKLKEKHFKYFKERCGYWISKFGLISWQIYYEFIELKDARGKCITDYSGRIATIVLSTEILCEKHEVQYYINRTAFHEVMELFLSPMEGCARDRKWDAEIYEREHHAVIRTLENLFLEKEEKV